MTDPETVALPEEDEELPEPDEPRYDANAGSLAEWSEAEKREAWGK